MNRWKLKILQILLLRSYVTCHYHYPYPLNLLIFFSLFRFLLPIKSPLLQVVKMMLVVLSKRTRVVTLSWITLISIPSPRLTKSNQPWIWVTGHSRWRKYLKIISWNFSWIFRHDFYHFREYVNRCYSKCKTPDEKDQISEKLKSKILQAASNELLWVKDWDKEPMPLLESEISAMPQTPVCKQGVYMGGRNVFTRPEKKNRNHSYSRFSPHNNSYHNDSNNDTSPKFSKKSNNDSNWNRKQKRKLVFFLRFSFWMNQVIDLSIWFLPDPMNCLLRIIFL